jgi:transcriptional regulator with XRE-family HTH domain
MVSEFGELLKTSRKAANLSQKDLMGKLAKQGYRVASKGTISKWENGISNPIDDVIELLEDVLHLPKGRLFRASRKPEMAEYREAADNKPIYENNPNNRKVNDPIVISARKEHLSEIRALIEKLRNFQQLVFMDGLQAAVNSKRDGPPTEVEAFEDEPLYTSLKEHIPIDAFWEDYSIWRDCWASYMDDCIRFWHFIAEEVNVAKGWPGVLRMYHKDIYYSIEGIIRDRNRKPIVFSKSAYRKEGVSQVTIWANGKAILTTTINAVTYTDRYSEIVQRVVNSAELETVRDDYEKAVAAKNKVDISLDNILLGRKYISTCRLCPGQPD